MKEELQRKKTIINKEKTDPFGGKQQSAGGVEKSIRPDIRSRQIAEIGKKVEKNGGTQGDVNGLRRIITLVFPALSKADMDTREKAQEVLAKIAMSQKTHEEVARNALGELKDNVALLEAIKASAPKAVADAASKYLDLIDRKTPAFD